MINIAIIEDNENDASLLKSYIDKYFENSNKQYKVDIFNRAYNFIDSNSDKYNIAFFDIEMPYMNGMEAAHKLREKDTQISIIFVTNMAKYAINGYEVDALDFIIKPVEYFHFQSKMDKALRIQEKYSKNAYTIECSDQIVRLNIQDILYVESDGHFVIYHTEKGTYRERNTIKKVEANLSEFDFVRCNNPYLVNLNQIVFIKKDAIQIGKNWLPISRSYKKSFMNAVTAFNCRR